jgi:hypothetical protein
MTASAGDAVVSSSTQQVSDRKQEENDQHHADKIFNDCGG